MGRTQEHVGVWMCWVRVRRVVRRVWREDGRRKGRVRARDSILVGWRRERLGAFAIEVVVVLGVWI